MFYLTAILLMEMTLTNYFDEDIVGLEFLSPRVLMGVHSHKLDK